MAHMVPICLLFQYKRVICKHYKPYSSRIHPICPGLTCIKPYRFGFLGPFY